MDPLTITNDDGVELVVAGNDESEGSVDVSVGVESTTLSNDQARELHAKLGELLGVTEDAEEPAVEE